MNLSVRLLHLLRTLLLSFVIAQPLLRAENHFYIPNSHVLEFSKQNEVFIHAFTDKPMVGFEIHLKYNPDHLKINSITDVGTRSEGSSFFDGKHDEQRGTIDYAAVFDIASPLDFVLHPEIDHPIVKLNFDVLAPEGTNILIEFVNSPSEEIAIAEKLNSVSVRVEGQDTESERVNNLTPGSLSVGQRGLSVDAGPDGVTPESSTMTLDGSQTFSENQRPLTYNWSQISPDIPLVIHSPDQPVTTIDVPPVVTDTTFTFKLEVDDGFGTLIDLVQVEVIDLESRKLSIALPQNQTTSRPAEDQRLIVFETDLTWDSIYEPGRLDGLVFAIEGLPEDRAQLSSPALYFDSNFNGEWNASDTLLSFHPQFDNSSDSIEFNIHELMPAKLNKKFFVIFEVPIPDPEQVAQAEFPFFGLILILALGSMIIALSQVKPIGQQRAQFLLSLTVLFIFLIPISCSSGGGGGGAPPPSSQPAPVAPQVGEVRLNLSEVHLRGDQSFVLINVPQLPVHGPIFKVK